MKVFTRLNLVAAATILIPALAFADTTVNGSTSVAANADIYAAGTQSTLATGDSSGQSGTVPGFITVTGSNSITFAVTGTITINGGTFNDADGVGAAPGSSSETGSGSISGITAPDGGYLVGVFIGSGGPTGSAPAALDYTASGNASESAASTSPLLDQVFFIGDGLTGDGTGTTQTFIVPAGATELYLGISDACNYNGSPSCYLDNNSGSFDVSYADTTLGNGNSGGNGPSPTPEPSSLMLLGTGILGAAGTLRRRMRISR